MHNNQNFSAIKSSAFFTELNQKEFDLVVVGGGITGAGIALDAVSRGLKVALFEQNDFASGTSSRSTKLIHGGLRYLKQGQLKFVAQLGAEREIIKKNAQHIVVPVPVLLPIYKGGQLKLWSAWLGLKLYDLLAGVKTEHRVQWIKKSALLNRYNFIADNGLTGAFLYYEYKTNDGRLVIEIIKKAIDLGAVCMNYTRVIKGLVDVEAGVELTLCNQKSMHTNTIFTKVVVNATGVWCNEFASSLGFNLPKQLFPTKGIHITLPKTVLPIKEAFYFDAVDGRMIFVIPRQDYVYIGTTDTPYRENSNYPTVNDKEIDYLLQSVSAHFPGLSISKNQVISCWAGIRPLLKGKGKNPGEISRKDEVFIHHNKVITIVGGKLTGYRLMADKVISKVFKLLKQPIPQCPTKTLKLSGSDWNQKLNRDKLVEQADYAFDEAKQALVSVEHFKKLFYRYGTNLQYITEKAYELMEQERDPEKLWLSAELWYAINYESVLSLSDFFIYRTEMVLFEPDKVQKIKNFVADQLAGYLGWDEANKEMQLLKFEDHWKQYQM